MCNVTHDLQTPPILHTATFSPLLWSVKYFMHDAPFSDSEKLRINYSAHAGCYSQIQELYLCWPLRLDTPCIWNYYHLELLSSRSDDLRLSCLLTQVLIPLESIANFNDAIQLFDYITLHFLLIVG